MEPAGRIEPQAWMVSSEAVAVMAALCGGGAAARFVGGCVRDAVLGRGVRDIDIATPEAPQAVTDRLAAAGIRCIPTGVEHGTVTAVVGRRHFEITALRHDVETYGRRAKVAFTDDWVADAARRDFTINALFADADGTLYDPVGGLIDLRAGRVRFVGDPARRIDEDALRILRFFRFHAHYGRGPADGDGMAACRAKAAQVSILSGERVCGELLRLLEAPDPAPVVDLMAEAGVLAQVLPEADGTGRLAAVAAIETARSICEPLRRLAALLDTDAAGVGRLADRLRLSNSQRERLLAAAVPAQWPQPSESPFQWRQLIYRVGAESFRDLVFLAWAAHCHGDSRPYEAMLETAATWQAAPPAFPLRGADVLALGVVTGKQVGSHLSELEAWWVAEDFIPDRDALLERLTRAVAAIGKPALK